MSTLIDVFTARLANARSIEGVIAIRTEMVEAGFSPRFADAEITHRKEEQAFAAKGVAGQRRLNSEFQRWANGPGIAAWQRCEFEVEVRTSTNITYGPN